MKYRLRSQQQSCKMANFTIVTLVYLTISMTHANLSCPSSGCICDHDNGTVKCTLYGEPLANKLDRSDRTRYLYLDSAGLKYLEGFEFRSLKDVRKIYLSNNELEDIPDETFSKCVGLLTLTLSGNKLSSVTSEIFQELANLEDLQLDNNRITYIHMDAFKGLENLLYLFLQHNRLQTLHPETFKTQIHINTLRLDVNRLHDVVLDFEIDSASHVAINLSENNIHILKFGFLSRLKGQQLDLSNNPLVCNCVLKERISNAKLKGSFNISNDTKCDRPRIMKGRPLNEMSNLSCEKNWFEVIFASVVVVMTTFVTTAIYLKCSSTKSQICQIQGQ